MGLLLPQDVEQYIKAAEAELGPACGDPFAVVIANHLRQWVKENTIEIDFSYKVTSKEPFVPVYATGFNNNCVAGHQLIIQRQPRWGLCKTCKVCGMTTGLSPEEEKEFLAKEQLPGAFPSGLVPGVDIGAN